MPESRRHGRPPGWRAFAGLAAFAALGLLTITAPAVVFGGDGGDLSAPRIHLAAVPEGEKCTDASPVPGAGQRACPDGPSGGGGLNLGPLLPILGVVVGAGVVALLVAFLVLRRRAGAPVAPADPGEWWTCRKCGRNNVIGSARCYACGTWQA